MLLAWLAGGSQNLPDMSASEPGRPWGTLCRLRDWGLRKHRQCLTEVFIETIIGSHLVVKKRFKEVPVELCPVVPEVTFCDRSVSQQGPNIDRAAPSIALGRPLAALVWDCPQSRKVLCGLESGSLGQCSGLQC